jgi:hypothetical protein
LRLGQTSCREATPVAGEVFPSAKTISHPRSREVHARAVGLFATAQQAGASKRTVIDQSQQSLRQLA